MGKQKSKSGKQEEKATNHLNLLTAIANLITALIILYEKMMSQGGRGFKPLPAKKDTTMLATVSMMDTMIYMGLGLTIAISLYVIWKLTRR